MTTNENPVLSTHENVKKIKQAVEKLKMIGIWNVDEFEIINMMRTFATLDDEITMLNRCELFLRSKTPPDHPSGATN